MPNLNLTTYHTNGQERPAQNLPNINKKEKSSLNRIIYTSGNMANQCSGHVTWSIQVTSVLNLLFKVTHNQMISKTIVKLTQNSKPTSQQPLNEFSHILLDWSIQQLPSTLAHFFPSQYPGTVPSCCCPFLCLLCPLFFQDQFSSPLLSKLSSDYSSSHVEGKIQRRNCLCSLHPTPCSAQDRYALSQVRRT